MNIATVGTITKKEQLRSVDLEKCKSLVLETSNPFPGYHGHNLPENNIPGSLFIVTKTHYSDETIVRAIQMIKQTGCPEFDATPCTVMLQNKEVDAIRFKLLSYKDVMEVVQLFNKNDIAFRDKKTVQPYDTLISIRKFFKIKKVEEGIYSDLECKNQYYFEIPRLLSWDSFEKITMNLKYNIEDSNFDAALVFIYTEKGIVDLVRIFNAEMNIDTLKLLRRKYLEKIK